MDAGSDSHFGAPVGLGVTGLPAADRQECAVPVLRREFDAVDMLDYEEQGVEEGSDHMHGYHLLRRFI